MTQSYLLNLAQYRSEQLTVGVKVCTPDQMFNHATWTQRETFENELGCQEFYFTELDPGSPYYDSHFFTVEQSAAYYIDGQIFGLMHAYQEATTTPGRMVKS